MNETKIEWTDRTWNPVTGCTKVSPGCDHCYAEGIARRFAGSKAFPNGFDVTLHPDRINAPFRWRKPARVFVNSMSDLFHKDIPDQFIEHVFQVMEQTPHHTYQVLTKRHGRMRSFAQARMARRQDYADQFTYHEIPARRTCPAADMARKWAANPPANIWLGVSVEDQKHGDLRIDALRVTPAAVRFVSAEPLIGPLRLDERWAGLDWLIIGGESGPGARRMELGWATDLVRDCRELGIAPFVKQLGSAHGPHKGGAFETWPAELRVREYPTEVAA